MNDMEKLRQSMALYSQRMELVADIWEGILGFCILAVGIWAFFAAGLFGGRNRWTGEWIDPTSKTKLFERVVAVIVMLIGLRLLYKAFFI